MAVSTIVGITGVVAGLVGTGVSYYSQQQAAASSRALADYNAKLSTQNAKTQYGIALAQSTAQKRALEAQAAQQKINAASIRTVADDATAAGRDEIRARREDGARLMAIQRARIAKSGIVEAGTPLDILADTAAEVQHGVELDLYEQNLARDQQYRAAAFEEAGAGATLLNASMADLQGKAAYAGYRNKLSAINLDRLTGQQQASAMRTNASATLLSGLSGAAGSAYGMYRNAPRSS